MSKETAATGTALTTVEEALSATGRAEILNQFARMALGTETSEAAAKGSEAAAGQETEAQAAETKPAEAETAEQQDDLSQSKAETETEPEAKAEEAEQPETTEEGEDELKGKLDEHTQQVINKRIAKEVGKTKAEREAREAAEAKLAELQQQLEQQPKPEPVPVRVGSVPLAHVENVAQLQAEQAKARAALKQSEELLDTLEDNPEDVEAALRQSNVVLRDEHGQEDYSVPKMRKFLKGIRRTADDVVTQAIPERAQYLDIQSKAQAKAQEIVPELKDLKSPRYAKFQEVVRAFPQLKTIPDWPMAAAVQVIGLEVLEAKLKAAQPVVAKAKPPLPVKIPQPKASAPTPKPAKPNQVSEATVQAAIDGDKNARLKVIQSLVPKFS